MKIELKGLSKSFGSVQVLKKCNLSLESGELICLVGSNGAGKTTLLRIISGLLGADRGQLFVDGEEWLLNSSEWRRKCALVAHKTFLYQNLTGLENLRFFSRLYQIDMSDAELKEKLAEVGLAKAGGRQVRTYSRGMQQRLTIARAILSRSDLLILDEAFTGLDKEGSELLNRILLSCKAEGTAILMTSHDPGLAYRISDAFVKLNKSVLTEKIATKEMQWSEIEGLLFPESKVEEARS